MAGVKSEDRDDGMRQGRVGDFRLRRVEVDPVVLGPYSDRREMYLDYIDACAGLTDDERRRFQQEYPETSKAVEGIVTKARNDGMRRGRAEGIQQGRVEGARAMLDRLLRRRFGPLPPEAAERLRRAPEADLETWADNVLDAGTLDDVFRTRR